MTLPRAGSDRVRLSGRIFRQMALSLLPASILADPSLASKHIAVIGAGPGGLASAMLLAHAGAKVTLYEKGDKIGGRSSCLEIEAFVSIPAQHFFCIPTSSERYSVDAALPLTRW